MGTYAALLRDFLGHLDGVVWVRKMYRRRKWFAQIFEVRGRKSRIGLCARSWHPASTST